MAYPISKISFSCLRTLFVNPGDFKDRYILNDSRISYSPAQLVGKMSHTVLEMCFTGTPLEVAVQRAQEFLETVKDEDVKWGKTGSREGVLKDFHKAVTHYFEEMPDYHQIEDIEKEMLFEVSDVIDRKVIKSPLPFHGIADLVYLDKEGNLIIEDYKFVSAFSDTEEEKPHYVFQSFFYYYLAKAQYGREPKRCVFREIKISVNKDGSSQHNCVLINYGGEKFDENKVYFWYNLHGMLRQIENADADTFFPYNIFDPVNGVENFRRQKETVFGYKREEVKNSEFAATEERGAKEVKFLKEAEAATVQDKIRIKFQDYGVPLKFSHVQEWYSYDRYLFEPGRGVKMSKISALKEEMKQALELKHVRIEAPVAGTKYVGVEVPRENRVFLPLELDPNRKDSLIYIGKGIDGQMRTIDLSDSNNPHAFVVGATGSGKSELLKVIVETSKDACDLVLIDPKRTELIGYKYVGEYYGVEPGEIRAQFEFLYSEMMRRYDLIAGSGVKDIEAYNALKRKWVRKLRRKLIVIEEYGMLKLSSHGKEIEHALLRIASLGRAAGFHLIISTQRPDVKIISGSLKANIPCRICFAVASPIDSKVALDEIGAENLVGKGDMLFRAHSGHEIERLQSFYVAK